ncbi:acetolactate synthase, large subunit [Verrucomicrobium sp. GAS474]|uniref:thiamine pyrophosphate-binding protein n=1 Tax=Verrucomicrobium sp. GAS474 TaxID=1882831 RepID=UPI00087DAE47|nr:thiamine pyrophosphate-binding protein [Verrucomicrobium sp. GAS474]SDT94664.1 acetolactate synthase, large subunit [Verrucomicrobium sp. GAS474]
MKLSDYVVDFLARKGVTLVFGMSGGALVHLFDSTARREGIDYVCSQHEQSAAMSADGYARVTGRLGVAMTTSGPGATNLLTGTCCSYYDSVPTLMLTGQVATHRLKGNRPIRQFGFQETDILSIFGTVTKLAVQIRDPKTIRYHLEKAYYTAFEGRPGPVLIDLPDDLQRAEVDPETLEGFTPPETFLAVSSKDLEELRSDLEKAERPLLILGGGLSTPRVGPELLQLIERIGVPVLVTWAGLDLIPRAHPLWVGPFGVYAPRVGNYAVQNADFLLAIGTRLSQNVTGGILSAFAPGAKITMVDADAGEMDKFDGRGIVISQRIQARAGDFLRDAGTFFKAWSSPGWNAWREKIVHWRQVLPHDRPAPPASGTGYVDAYRFIESLSSVVPEGEALFVDTGGNLTWTCNGFEVRSGQRLISAWNNTPMGYSLPAAIGAAAFDPTRPVTCIIGDGGLMICLGELATVVKHRLPIRVILFNNHGHGIQKQTLETWLEGRYEGVHPESGLAFPEFPEVAKAFGFQVVTISDSIDMEEQLRGAYATKGPVFINVEINPSQKLYPVLKFGAALENQLPAMSPEAIANEMILPPNRIASQPHSTGTPGV